MPKSLELFLGQAGVKRQELGDIIVSDNKIQVFVSKHLVESFKAIEKNWASSGQNSRNFFGKLS